MITRRTALAAVAAAAAGAATAPRPARAATPAIRFARQFSMGYLQFNVMEHGELVQKHAAALGLPAVDVSWITFNGPDAMNSALISDSVDIVAGGIPGLLTLWTRTHNTAQEVRGVSALSSQPCLLNTRNPKLRTIEDLGPDDRIAVPSVKSSIQAVTLEMAVAKRYGSDQYARFDNLTVSMAPPEATIALLSGGAGLTCAFSVPPFQQQQLDDPAIHTLLNSFDVAGPHSFTLAWTNARFRSRNPVLYQALLAALKEATAIVNADRAAAARLWLADSKSKLSPDFAARVVSGPQVSWTMTPQGTMEYARFMQSVGTLKAVPSQWTDLFFPDVHGLPGS